jgi:hypothetical protein
LEQHDNCDWRLDITGLLATSSTPVSLKFYIDNVGSTSLYKVYTYSMASTQGSVFNTNSSWGYWNNDTGAITGIEVLFGGTSSGTCSLYGLDWGSRQEQLSLADAWSHPPFLETMASLKMLAIFSARRAAFETKSWQ